MARATLAELVAHCLGAALIAGIVAVAFVIGLQALRTTGRHVNRRISRWADEDAPRP